MALSLAEVERISLLARLQLNEVELAAMAEQLGQVVEYFRQLDEVDTSQVEPLAHAGGVQNVFADDELQASLPRDLALANAPKQDGECFRVPAVLGD